jgi:DMSO reductase anchor subunit
MAQVYRLRAVPAWNTWRTNAGFMVSALLLGQIAMWTLLPYASKVTDDQFTTIGSIVLVLLLIQLALIHRQAFPGLLKNIRVGLIVIGVITIVTRLFSSNVDIIWLKLLIALIVVTEEGIGRWLFYRSRLSILRGI